MARGNIAALSIFGIVLALFVYFFISGGESVQAQPAPPMPAGTKQYATPPAMTINPEHKYTATIDTAKGKIVVELFAKDAPLTVNNFVFLARERFYNGTTFHRVIPDFMIQGGDPTATGAGGPGYKFADEVGPDKPHHKVGTLSMANAGPGTNGSQFFITHIATTWLDGKHTVFGQTTEGQDVVNAIAKGDMINTITIEEVPATPQTALPAPTTSNAP